MGCGLREAKAGLRARMAMLRDAIPPERRREADQAITERLLSLPEWDAAEVVFVYVSFRSEVGTGEILSAALESGRTLLVPRVDRERRVIEACRVGSLGELAPGAWGILEPGGPPFPPNVGGERGASGPTAADPAEIDLVVAPGLAFDRQGTRLGYGAGYYDRFLRNVRPDCARLGLAYELQILSEVPSGPDDECMDGVVTEVILHRSR